jgi:TPR repeat protein
MTGMKKIIVVTLLLASLNTPISWGADFDKGYAAAQRGDYSTALSEWMPLAEQGNVSAQYNLGVMYENGTGTPQNYKIAVKWYTLAAEQGFAGAQYNLNTQYSLGQGITENYIKAHMWSNIAQYNESNLAGEVIEDLVKSMTQEQIAKAQDLVQECVDKDYKGC